MHLYWRIKEELRYLGEELVFRDPSLLREYRRWIQKRSGSLASFQCHDTPMMIRQPCGWVTLACLN